MCSYRQEYGHFPPAAVRGKSGEHLYSWRVALLRYLEQEALLSAFNLEEPWDGAHNAALVRRMPSVYGAPGRKAALLPPGHTCIHVLVGPGTAFEGWEGLPPDAFPDGTSNTILLVEGGPPVPWTKPEELMYEPNQPLPELATLFPDGFRCAMVDGWVRWVPRQVDERLFRAAVTRNGGEVLPEDWDKCR